ncbi:NADH-quinone oxidoreductase subunit B [Filimonas sp.]|nr:NADH-quinone oxidoreductase subunit B [Filimonas sp.]
MDMITNVQPENFPGQIHELPGGGIVLSKLDDVINWARSNSLGPHVCHELLRYRIYVGGRCQIRFLPFRF